MHDVRAPKGYEGSRHYNDGARQWVASARAIGSTWWTTVGHCGHAQMTPEELDTRAELLIEQAVKIGIVR